MKLSEDCPKLKGLDFSKEQIENCISNNSVLRLSLALSKKCNLECPFCYANEYRPNPENNNQEELSFEEIKDVIIQAKENGARTVGLVGGEPLIYPKIKEIVSFINSNNLVPLIFTNGTAMNEELAKFFYDNNVSIIVKFNSFDNPEIQDKMVGSVKGTFYKIKNTIEILTKEGFNNTIPTRLAIETVISRENISQIPNIFRFARKNNIYPYIELITPAGRGKRYLDILTKKEAKEIFYKLLRIDETEFGYTWIPRPPQVAATCKYYFTALYVKPYGKVQPCPTVNIELGNLKKEKLSEILNKPQTKQIRNMRANIKGKCKTCDYHLECYGCRGAAFNSTGGIFNEDPICWI
jgi:radical SAM protein with 4Fe4S-binding SPASM domain